MQSLCLHRLVHPAVSRVDGKVLQRMAARAIVRRDDQILMLYTRRYDDYSFPGGGIEYGEDPLRGLRRELAEETGARDIQVLSHYGHIDEYRPSPKPGFDVMFMRSYFYVCAVADALGEHAMEQYEIRNGMEPRWVALHEALQHNEQLLVEKPDHMGFSIQRETWMLRQLTALGAAD